MLQQPEFSVALFIFCLSAFGWPFISIPGADAPIHMFCYLFAVWGLVIVLLFIISRASARSDKNDEYIT